MQQSWSPQYGRVKEISQLKKSINLGEIPAHFHIVASKLSEVEGIFTDGFDNNVKYLLNQDNWRHSKLTEGKPLVSLRKSMTEYAYELYCFPVIDGEPQAVVSDTDSKSPFLGYNPVSQGSLIRLPQLNDLISIALRKGDEADFELLKYAHMLVEQLVELLGRSLNVQEVCGQSIKDVFLFIDQQIKDMKIA